MCLRPTSEATAKAFEAARPVTRSEYARSLHELADHFRLFCPEAAVSLRQEAQKFDYHPAFGPPPPTPRKPREWNGYVSVSGGFVPCDDPAWKSIKVREVIEL